ncbi:MAG: radical SAM family heme chaperone HemW [Actinomycetota bacterium]|nr:radical SAM family heme chaperone HemW [Actinomycetota bacterium]
MPSTLPAGQPIAVDASMPRSALTALGEQAFGVYVHVPFCAVRCGYCDFNTYTASELGAAPGASRATYAEAAIEEIRLARKLVGDRDVAVDTVFFGGGTPTLLPASDLVAVLDAIRDEFGLAPGAEVTTESNPDSVTAQDLAALRDGGINRVSFGMQSAVPSVLRVLDRTHDPARLGHVVRWAREAGFDEVSLDLIYGTPGESLDEWRRSLEAALALSPDHVSAYALVVERGTALARRISRGELSRPDDDDLADKYELADALLAPAGYGWYEVSNWALNEKAWCRHNVGYWQGADWWGVGPGAHSHVGGVRWWNVKHPTAYADRINARRSPVAGRELLDGETRRVERVMLETRLVTGLPLDALDDDGRAAVDDLAGDGLVELSAAEVGGRAQAAAPGRVDDRGPDQRLVLTRRGRLLADAVVRALLPR